MLNSVVLLVALWATSGSTARADEAPETRDFGEERWRAAAFRGRRATVQIEGDRCTGFLAHDTRTVVSAAHCVREGERQLEVMFASGRTMSAKVRRVDPRTDVAWLWLPEAASETPLVVRSDLPRVGEQLVFTGSTLRPADQIVDVDRISPCPSLPRLRETLFTSLRAVPGHSGAPVVDRYGRVTGMVHGGARCHILVPSTAFALPEAAPGAVPAGHEVAREADRQPRRSRVSPPPARREVRSVTRRHRLKSMKK